MTSALILLAVPLCLGLLTPAAAVACAALHGATLACSDLEPSLSAIVAIANASALAMLGPGAYSIDCSPLREARLRGFERRRKPLREAISSARDSGAEGCRFEPLSGLPINQQKLSGTLIRATISGTTRVPLDALVLSVDEGPSPEWIWAAHSAVAATPRAAFSMRDATASGCDT